MDMHTNLDLDLHLFDGAAGAEGSGAGAGEGQAAAPTATGKGKNALADVTYGKQPEADAEGAPTTEPTEPASPDGDPADKAAAFEAMIKGEYKDVFAQRTQGIIDARFKETKGLEAQLAAHQPMLDALAARYGVDPTDTKALQKAMDDDDSYYEAAASERGLTVPQMKEVTRIERENVELKRAAEAQAEAENAKRHLTRWMQQSEQLKQQFPGFDLQAECDGPNGHRFVALLKSSEAISVEDAYKLIHQDELMSGALQYAVQTTQKRVTDDIRARGARPSENGASGSAPARIVKSDPSKYTKADRGEIERRVLRGERIEL